MKYRSEIDGLRALAVIPVILFHAGFQSFSGGFIGVDVFFVISGYLITSIILLEKEAGTFSLSNFYERRARRILPALFVVMAASIPLAYLWLIPPDLKNFSESLFSTSTFTSNFLFFSESGYFDRETELKPLLHTWSLSVEEQYYLFFPLFLLITWKLKRNKIIFILVTITLLSFFLAQWISEIRPNAAFYLLPTRVWELLVGSLIAFYLINKNTIQGNQYLSFFGLLLIICSIYLFDEYTPFPSVYTLMPIIGSGLIIVFTSEKTFIYKILSNKLMVGIGLISYSAYLWHFPLLAFSKYRNLNELNSGITLTLITLTFLLAYLTWRYIEKPTRNRAIFNREKILKISIIGSISFMLIGYYGHQTDGLKDRSNFKQIYQEKETDRHKKKIVNNSQYRNLYMHGKSGATPEFAIIGDSHAKRLLSQLEVKSIKNNTSFLSFSKPHCAPLLGFILLNKSNQEECLENRHKAFDAILNNENISTVVLTAQWANYTQGYRDNEIAKHVEFNGERSVNIADNTRIFEKSINYTINKLINKNKRVIIIHPTPEFSTRIQDYVIKVKYFKEQTNNEKITININKYKDRTQEVLMVFNKIKNINFIQVSDLFCKNEQCSGVDDSGGILFSDTNHVTALGAKIIVNRLNKELSKQ